MHVQLVHASAEKDMARHATHPTPYVYRGGGGGGGGGGDQPQRWECHLPAEWKLGRQ